MITPDPVDWTVPTTPPLPAVLREHRARQVAGGLDECPWVFPNRSGELHKGSPLKQALDEACRVASVPHISIPWPAPDVQQPLAPGG